LWSASLDGSSADVSDGLSDLSEEEIERAGRMRVDRDRRRFVVSHVWLRRLLADQLEVEPTQIEYRVGVAGKPEIASSVACRLRFSMSHSGGLALYAFSLGREVGVDVEEFTVDVDLAPMERRFLSAAERNALALLEGTERRRAFYRTWVRKEAFLKAIGVGLGAPWRAIDTTSDIVRLDREAAHLPIDSSLWSLRDLEVEPAWTAAVSVEGGFDSGAIQLRDVADRKWP
jgi:4'-phosphopantetheinyl transferase